MSVETQVVLDEVQRVKNLKTNEDEPLRPATRYLRFEERESREGELKQIEDVLAAPPWANPHMTAETRRGLDIRKKEIRKDLNRNSPKPISGETRDAVAALERQLAEKIREGMPANEVMRRNPPGAVDAHIKWEKANKDRILAWKNCRVLLNPDSNEKDLCNVEMLRPSLAMPGSASTFMPDAQISGHFAMTPLARENWPLGEPTVSTALQQAKEREEKAVNANPPAAAPKKVKPVKRPNHMTKQWTEEQRAAARDRMIAGKRAAQEKRDAEAAARWEAEHPTAQEA